VPEVNVKTVLVWFLLIFVLKLSTSNGNRGLRPASGYPLMMMMMMMIRVVTPPGKFTDSDNADPC